MGVRVANHYTPHTSWYTCMNVRHCLGGIVRAYPNVENWESHLIVRSTNQNGDGSGRSLHAKYTEPCLSSTFWERTYRLLYGRRRAAGTFFRVMTPSRWSRRHEERCGVVLSQVFYSHFLNRQANEIKSADSTVGRRPHLQEHK